MSKWQLVLSKAKEIKGSLREPAEISEKTAWRTDQSVH
jgi:hypothetical protein